MLTVRRVRLRAEGGKQTFFKRYRRLFLTYRNLANFFRISQECSNGRCAWYVIVLPAFERKYGHDYIYKRRLCTLPFC